jgi:hypothetical protein
VHHATTASQKNRQGRLERVFQPRGNCNAPLHLHSVVAEKVVDAHTVRMMCPYSIIHAVSDVASVPIRLRHIIGHLRLEEVGLATLAGPLDQVLQRMLYGEPIHCHVVTSDNEACVAGEFPVLHQSCHTVICTPEPQIVADDVP